MKPAPVNEADRTWPMGPKTIADVKTAKRDLETQISQLLSDFGRTNGVTVEYVNIGPKQIGNETPSGYYVTLDVKL